MILKEAVINNKNIEVKGFDLKKQIKNILHHSSNSSYSIQINLYNNQFTNIPRITANNRLNKLTLYQTGLTLAYIILSRNCSTFLLKIVCKQPKC